jgi:uncharacterized membrane protein YdbT with pleckstrin-like domain
LGSYIEKSLGKGEEIKYSARVSLWRFWLRIIIGACLVVGSLWAVIPAFLPQAGKHIASGMEYSMGAVLVIGLILLIWPFLARRATEIVITDRRLIAKSGFFSTNSIEIRFEKIETVRVNQSLAGKIFGYGDILVTGTGSTFDPITDISRPMVFRTALNQAMELGRSAGR